MPQAEQVEVTVQGPVDWLTAQDLAARIRAAMHNDIPTILLCFDRSTQITSAEFLAFLSAAAAELKRQGRRLCIAGAKGKNRSLLEISGLHHHLIEDAPIARPVFSQET
jgi:anti-anti-sigma regulatory factor